MSATTTVAVLTSIVKYCAYLTIPVCDVPCQVTFEIVEVDESDNGDWNQESRVEVNKRPKQLLKIRSFEGKTNEDNEGAECHNGMSYTGFEPVVKFEVLDGSFDTGIQSEEDKPWENEYGYNHGYKTNYGEHVFYGYLR